MPPGPSLVAAERTRLTDPWWDDYLSRSTIFAGLAQLVERRLPKPKVASSRLVSRSGNGLFLAGLRKSNSPRAIAGRLNQAGRKDRERLAEPLPDCLALPDVDFCRCERRVAGPLFYFQRVIPSCSNIRSARFRQRDRGTSAALRAVRAAECDRKPSAGMEWHCPDAGRCARRGSVRCCAP